MDMNMIQSKTQNAVSSLKGCIISLNDGRLLHVAYPHGRKEKLHPMCFSYGERKAVFGVMIPSEFFKKTVRWELFSG
jgi:hypothetical protein